MYLFLGVFLFLVPITCVGQDDRNTTGTGKGNMKNNDKYIPSVESLTPYVSSITFFKGRLKEEDMLELVFTISSPAESYATMIKNTLESKSGYNFTVTITPIRDPGTREPESWRIHGISKKLRVGDLSGEEHHAVTGWIYSLSVYFKSDLKTLAYRL